MYAGLKLKKLIGVAGIQRQIGDLVLVHDRAELGTGGIHERSLGSDVHSLFRFADLHHHVQRDHLVQVDVDITANILLEPGVIEFHPIDSDGHLGKGVVAVIVAHVCLGDAGRLIHGGDTHSCQHCSAGIRNSAEDSSAGALRFN